MNAYAVESPQDFGEPDVAASLAAHDALDLSGLP